MTRGRHFGMLRVVSRALLVLVPGLLAALPLNACSSGTETGNPSFQAELSYAAYSSQPLAIGVREVASRAVVESAWLDLGAVRLFRAGTCANVEPEAQSLPALGVGDHASGDHNATRFELAASQYCALDLPFARVAAGAIRDGEPASLEQHSLMIAGLLSDGTPFSILSSAVPTVHLIADAGSFEISPGRANTLIAFDVATWLADLDWQSAQRENGAVVLSADQNPALLAAFESNLARGIALYRDTDGDGRLDTNPERLAHSVE